MPHIEEVIFDAGVPGIHVDAIDVGAALEPGRASRWDSLSKVNHPARFR